MAQIDVFDTTLRKTSEWLREIMRSLDWNQPQRAYLSLRAVMQTLRDRLPVNEAAHLGAQLPMLIRGIYYESWSPADKPEKKHRQELDLSPKLRQTVKTQFSANGELCHGNATKIHEGV